MKITINSKLNKKRSDINNLIDSLNNHLMITHGTLPSFFDKDAVKYNEYDKQYQLSVKTNANKEKHTRLVAVVSLWLCLSKTTSTFARISSDESDAGLTFFIHKFDIPDLIEFVDGLDLNNITLDK